MNCDEILQKHYSHCAWCAGDTYESIMWNDKNTPKPSEEELQSLWEDTELHLVRQERNRLLQLTDFRALPDYPNRDQWLVYRQELRDLTKNWTGTYPQEPK